MLIRRLRFRVRLVVSLIALSCISVLAQDAPTASANVVPQGTVFLIQLSDRIDTRTVKAGDHFQARLAEPLVAASGQTIETGTKIKGHISAVEPGLRTRVLLSFEGIDTTRGWVPLIATVTGVPGEHGLRQIGEEGEIGRQGMTKEQIAEAIVVGAGKGAAQANDLAGSVAPRLVQVLELRRERCRLLRRDTTSCLKRELLSRSAWIATLESGRGRVKAPLIEESGRF